MFDIITSNNDAIVTAINVPIYRITRDSIIGLNQDHYVSLDSKGPAVNLLISGKYLRINYYDGKYWLDNRVINRCMMIGPYNIEPVDDMLVINCNSKLVYGFDGYKLSVELPNRIEYWTFVEGTIIALPSNTEVTISVSKISYKLR